MPDGSPFNRDAVQKAALDSVEAWLSTLSGTARRLAVAELARYEAHRFIAGWRIEVEFEQAAGSIALDILAGRDFPNVAIRIAVADGPAGRVWPHLESDGLLCLLSNSASIDIDAPVEVARHQLGEACTLIEESLAGTNRDDFLSEVESYWTRGFPGREIGLRTLVKVAGPSRVVKVWRGKGFDLVGDCDEDCLQWLTHIGGNPDAKNLADGLFLWMDRPPLPEEYPSTGADLRAMVAARCPDGLPLLEVLLARDPADLVILLAAATKNGAGLLGATVARGIAPQRPRGSRSRSTAGFTGRTVPLSVAVPRYVGSATVQRRLVTRVDAAWIHGRGLDVGAQALRNMKVAVLGCGSVGGPIAVRLAQAGVGSLILVDGDLLSSSNIGRHPLGMVSLNRFKATALADELKTRFPHLKLVQGIPDDWRTAHAEHPDLLKSCDLIIAAMADWTANSLLNEWHVSQGRPKPILYAWTEAHACAGHAVLVTNDGGCLRCGFSSTGLPLLRVCEWPTETQAQEPACGAVFQPYGPVEMAHVEALACELATDALLAPPATSVHHVWAARRSLLASTGGSWTREWSSLHPGRDAGAFMDQRPWFSGPCPACSQTP